WSGTFLISTTIARALSTPARATSCSPRRRAASAIASSAWASIQRAPHAREVETRHGDARPAAELAVERERPAVAADREVVAPGQAAEVREVVVGERR